MVSIVSDLAKSTLEKLINATIEESRYICCFTCITDDFEKEKENLKAKKETWEEYARVATRRGDNIRKDVTHWQKQAKELIEEDTKMKVKCFFGWCPNCIWQYSRGKELESKTEKIKKLMECNFENVGITRDVPDIEYHSSQNYVSFKSRKLKFEELFNALKDDNNYMIGLQGMGGIGKTTLAKEVGKELKKSKCFNQVIDTTISNSPYIKRIQDEIAGPLGLSFENCTESERARKLMGRLTNADKILLILDDVWGNISFGEIGIPFKDNHNNCKILVTTRYIRACNEIGCEKIIQLDILPEEEGWILFQKYAGLSDNSSKSILYKGRKISKECKGLPIAIEIIASSLKGTLPLEEWDLALKSLQKSMHVHYDDESLRKIYTCLKYSYDNMKDQTTKKLFLLCSMFREDEEISEELLVRLAKGATLIEKIDDDDSYDECGKKVIVAKYKLIDSCLLLNCKSGRVKMHDLVREMALWIVNEEIVAVNTSKKNEMTMVEKGKDIKYLLCEGKISDLFSSKFDGSKLDILIVNMNDHGPVEVPNSFFENIPGLQVLILSNNRYKRAILSLPQSIQLLTNIKSLYLKQFSLGDISILGNLQTLETVEFVKCGMDELPREIGKLVKLKLLKLNYCRFERSNVFEVIKSYSSLEELHLVTTYDNKIFKDCHLELPNYQRFCIGEHFRDIYPEWFLRNSLDVDNAMEIFSEETLKNLVQKAEILRLRGPIGVWKNLIPDIIFPEDESTNNLMEIALEDNSELTCLIDNNDSLVQSALSRLVTLELEGMKNLKEICNGPLPSEFLKNLETFHLNDCIHLQGALFKSKISLCNLKTLSIRSCPMLTSLFELSTTQSLLSLETLHIMSCEQLKSIIRDENKWKDSGEEIVDTHNNNKSTISIFPNLTTLYVYECRLLHFVLPVTQKIPKLESITIRNCDGLKYLFGRYQHEHEEEDLHQELKDVIFTSLKYVYLDNLPNFVDIFQKCDESFCSLKKSTSKDETKGKIESKSRKYKVLHWTHKYKSKWRTTKIPYDSKDQLQDSSLSMVNEAHANDVIAQYMRVELENMSLNDTSKILFTLQNVTELHINRCT
ncbi:probable disease resistance protein At1g15890 [Vigna radiata var. radiata]|uniref:Probable disease resistance protein At1g15890 n=1 Tax=Vigna radiata var. radiata TaxID=3916 RepID=A0A3Q0FG75_VIGRR|nr:probable disease resistance protein At1g15890 [Vigna radiata var. radiata]